MTTCTFDRAGYLCGAVCCFTWGTVRWSWAFKLMKRRLCSLTVARNQKNIVGGDVTSSCEAFLRLSELGVYFSVYLGHSLVDSPLL